MTTPTNAATTTTKQNPPAVKPDRVLQCAWAYTLPLMIEAAIKHRVFDVLDKGPKTLDELRQETNASTRGLRSLCDALTSIEFLKKEQGRYSLTPESEAFLVSTKPSFQGGIFRHVSTQLIPAWLNLNEIVATGKPPRNVNEEKAGGEFFEKFVEDIFPMSYQAALALGNHLNLPSSTQPVSVLDLAAGSGVWGIGLAQKSQLVRVRAIDWPNVIPVTKRITKRFELSDRFTFVEGDINTADLGSGHQIATLGHIIHSEGESRSRGLIKRVYDSLAAGGTIAIAEWTPNEARTGPANALIFAVNMLVNTADGDTYTFNEIKSWLEAAGFKDVRQLEAPAPSPLILATKPRLPEFHAAGGAQHR